MILRYLGQSGYELSTGSTRILIDPYFSDIVGRLHGRPRLLPIPMPPAEMPCDAVFCTHSHLDHLDPDTAVLFPENQLFYTTAEGCQLLADLSRHNAHPMKLGERIAVGDFSVIPVYACHTADAVGLVVTCENITLYFSGDTLFDEKLFEISSFKPDVTFICINGQLGNMTCEEALITAKTIGAKVNIPNHYDMFASNSYDPHKFAGHIAGGRILEFNHFYNIAQWL